MSVEKSTDRACCRDSWASFECGAATWDDYTRSSLGALRQVLVLCHILDYLGPTAPLEALDIGAGTGGYSLALAQAGHRVTLTDFSPAMLDLARRHFDVAGDQIAARATFLQSPVSDLDQVFPRRRFDLVLVHTLLEYLPDAENALGRIVRFAAPGGLVSLLIVNTHSDVLRLGSHKHEPEAALQVLRGHPPDGGLFATGRHLVELSDALHALERAGVEVVSHRGIRVFADGYAPHELAQAETFEAVMRLELACGGLEPYRSIARYHHLLGVRSAVPSANL